MIALIGIGLGVFMVVRGQRTVVPAKPIIAPASAPYESFISGSGIIEASSDNVKVGPPNSGLVEDVYVDTGDSVTRGGALFRLDTRQLNAELALSQSQLAVARARVAEAEASLKDVKSQLALAERIQDKRAISIEELDRRRYAVALSQAKLLTAKAEVTRNEAEINLIAVDLARLTVRAPIDGVILQSNINAGEYVLAGDDREPLLLLGVTNPMRVRVDIDETDAWRFEPGAPATGVLRGNPNVVIPLQFKDFEPYVIPKQSLTGELRERVDTRVLQVLYLFDPTGYPVYIGQQMDVYIKAPATASTTTES